MFDFPKQVGTIQLFAKSNISLIYIIWILYMYNSYYIDSVIAEQMYNVSQQANVPRATGNFITKSHVYGILPNEHAL